MFARILIIFSMGVSTTLVLAGSSEPGTKVSALSQKQLREYAATVDKSDPSEFILAKCFIKQPGLPNLAMPCPPLTFRLLDRRGKELRRALSQYGELKLRVEKKRTYFLVLDSAKFEMDTDKFGPLHAGENPIIEVRAKAISSRQ